MGNGFFKRMAEKPAVQKAINAFRKMKPESQLELRREIEQKRENAVTLCGIALVSPSAAARKAAAAGLAGTTLDKAELLAKCLECEKAADAELAIMLGKPNMVLEVLRNVNSGFSYADETRIKEGKQEFADVLANHGADALLEAAVSIADRNFDALGRVWNHSKHHDSEKHARQLIEKHAELKAMCTEYANSGRIAGKYSGARRISEMAYEANDGPKQRSLHIVEGFGESLDALHSLVRYVKNEVQRTEAVTALSKIVEGELDAVAASRIVR